MALTESRTVQPRGRGGRGWRVLGVGWRVVRWGWRVMGAVGVVGRVAGVGGCWVGSWAWVLGRVMGLGAGSGHGPGCWVGSRAWVGPCQLDPGRSRSAEWPGRAIILARTHPGPGQ